MKAHAAAIAAAAAAAPAAGLGMHFQRSGVAYSLLAAAHATHDRYHNRRCN